MACMNCHAALSAVFAKLRLARELEERLAGQAGAAECRGDCTPVDAGRRMLFALCTAISGTPSPVVCPDGAALLITEHWWHLGYNGGLLITAPHGNIGMDQSAPGRPAGDRHTWQIASALAGLVRCPALRGPLPRYLADFNRAFNSYEQPASGRMPALSYHLALRWARLAADGGHRTVLDLHGFGGSAAQYCDAVIAWEGEAGGMLAAAICGAIEGAGHRALLRGRDKLPSHLAGNYTMREYGRDGSAVQLELSPDLREDHAACARLLATACRGPSALFA